MNNEFMKHFLEERSVELYSTDDEVKSKYWWKIHKTLGNQIHKYMAAFVKNSCFVKLDDILSDYNNFSYCIKIESKRCNFWFFQLKYI